MLNINLKELEELLRRHEEWPEERPKRGQVQRSRRTKKAAAANKKLIDFTGMSQADLDAQARSAILDMFPAIPKATLLDIVEHAFEIVSNIQYRFQSAT